MKYGRDNRYRQELERMAFLYLCGGRDRKLLSGKGRMTFTDFDRLLYITDLIGFSELNLEIWETYSGHFQKQFQEFERWVQDSSDDMVFNLTERENDMSEKWVEDFLGQIPDRKSEKIVKRWMQGKNA